MGQGLALPSWSVCDLGQVTSCLGALSFLIGGGEIEPPCRRTGGGGWSGGTWLFRVRVRGGMLTVTDVPGTVPNTLCAGTHLLLPLTWEGATAFSPVCSSPVGGSLA